MVKDGLRCSRNEYANGLGEEVFPGFEVAEALDKHFGDECWRQAFDKLGAALRLRVDRGSHGGGVECTDRKDRGFDCRQVTCAGKGEGEVAVSDGAVQDVREGSGASGVGGESAEGPPLGIAFFADDEDGVL